MLYLFRNVAMITQPQHLPSQGDENEISRSATIEAFHEQDIFNLLLTIGSGTNDEFQEQDVVVLETLFHLLKGVDPKKLFMEKEQLATEETDELRNLIQKEKAMLNGYNKHAPTRHNRFGTMIWVKRDDKKVSTVMGQNSISNADTTFLQMDASKRINKPKYRGKQVEELDENAEFGRRVELTDNARKHLRAFVENFLDSSFNPLFSSLRKAIERESDRVTKKNHSQFFYLISWFLSAEAARRDRHQQTSQSIPEDNSYAYVAAVLDQETFVLLTRHMQRASDEKSWHDLQAILLCFTQILLTVQSMAESKDEEDLEIAENIQNRIFYEEAMHDLLVHILRDYKNQGFGFLDAVTECVHVFVRMLERYSKQNEDLYIRSKRRARKKRKDASGAGVEGGEEEDDAMPADDEFEAQQAVRERKFDFARFSAKFLSQPCVDTFISLIHFYADLTPAQLKRCHRYLYRLAFKHELAVFLFRVDILQLLHRMIKGPSGLDHAIEGFKDWEQLVQQVFRRCIKWIERESEGDGWKEAAVIEMLFSKIPNTVFYLQNGYERVIERRAPRPPAELVIKANVEDQEKRVGVAVSLMLEQGKQDAVEWVKRELKNAADERQAWEDERAARSDVQRMAEDVEYPDEGIVLPAPTIFLSHDSDERKEQLFKDKYLRLLLTTLGMQRLGTAEDVDASWIVPSELPPKELAESLERIRKAEFEPPTFEDGQSMQDLIRNKAAGRSGATFSDTESGSEGDIDEAMFPPNLREQRKEGAEPAKKRQRLTRRNKGEFTEEQLKEKAEERNRREREKNSKIKSALYVVDSDDEDNDEEFFRLEEERRKKMRGIIRNQLLKEALDGEEKGKKRKAEGTEDSAKKKRKPSNDEDVEMESDDGEVNTNDYSGPARLTTREVVRLSSDESSTSDDDSPGGEKDALPEEQLNPRTDEEEETPSTSPIALDNPTNDLPLSEVSPNVGVGKDASVGKIAAAYDEEGDDDDVPLLKPAAQRRSVRAGFIIDDSDSE